MIWQRILLGAAAASLAASPSLGADAAPTVAAYEAAMREANYRSAARTADALASRHRLEAREPRPDPLLNGLFGRLYLRRGEPAVALPYLRRSESPELPAPQRIAAGFALAESEEALGEWAAAADTWRRLLSLPLAPGEKLDARIALARVRLADDPAAALAEARAVAPEAPAGRRWEAEMVSAQALSLLGRPAEAEAAAVRAWADSGEAATAEAAPVRVALVRAGLAAAAGRRGPLLAMLSTANASLNTIDSNIASAAPVCGEGGITPSDHAIFAAHSRSDSIQWLTPVAASRPAAASAFRAAIAGRALLSVTGTPPGGLVFTLRCRGEPSADYAAAPGGQPWIQWFADRGLYFVLAADSELDNINRVAAEIDTLVSRYGEDHATIIPLRLSLLEMLERRAASKADVEEWQVAELRRKAGAALAKAGGAEGFLPDTQAEAEQKRLEQAGSHEQALAIYRASYERMIGKLPAPHAYSAFREWISADKDLPGETRRRIVESLLARIGSGSADPVRRALLRRLGHLAKQGGEPAAARAAFAAAGVPKDSCGMFERPPGAEEHGLSDDDYPPDTVNPNIAGVTALELDLGADGRVTSSRAVLAAPSLLFDRVLETKIPAFRYHPAAERSRSRACRNLQQTIRWQMPEEGPTGPPMFAPVGDGSS